MSLQEFPEFDQAVRARLQTAIDELEQEFGEIYHRSEIGAVVEESARQLARGEVAAFVPVLAQRFARERLQALAHADGRLAKPTLEVLFVSLTGGGRAQIGAALLAQRSGSNVHVHSAGSDIGSSIDDNVVVAMREVGVDLSDEYSKPLSLEVLAAADVVVTMGRSVGMIEIPPTTRHLDWRVGDPAGADLDEVRRVREDIERRVVVLAAALETQTTAGGASPGGTV